MLANCIKPIITFNWLLFWLCQCVHSDDSVVQIVLKKPINIVSDKFISFSIDPAALANVHKSASVTNIVSSFGPAYLKLVGPSTSHLTLDDISIPVQPNQLRCKPTDWRSLSDWMRTVNLHPIVALPYRAYDWHPREVIKILGISNRMGVDKCVWQLGADFNVTDAITYVDDLQTLRTMLDAFSKNQWNVVGSDVSVRSDPNEAKLFTEMSQHIVESIGWTQPNEQMFADQSENTLFERNPMLRGLQRSKTPVWLNVPADFPTHKYGVCSDRCVANGLQWAQTLGTAAQDGFKVVFKSIDDQDIVNPSLSYYVTLLHKKVVGEKVFDSKIINSNKDQTQFYTHCSRNVSGSFTVMAINFAETITKLSAKLPSKYAGTEVLQYILTVDANGIVNINNEPVNRGSGIDPVIKIKRPNRPTSFSLPPRSIGFWLFPSANLMECINTSAESGKTNTAIRPKTSSELLLQELIAESVSTDGDARNRTKRHAVVKKDSRHMQRSKREVVGSLNRNDVHNVFDSEVDRAKRFAAHSRSANMMDLLDKNIDARHRKYLTTPFGLTKKLLSCKQNMRRSKRHINDGLSKLFETLELAKPRKLIIPPIFKIGRPLGFPPIVSNVHDVYKVDSAEKIFKPSENQDLPSGDVYVEVGANQQGQDYVEFDENDNSKATTTPDIQKDLDVQIVQPKEEHGFYDMYNDMSGASVIEIMPAPSDGELWETDSAINQEQPSEHVMEHILATEPEHGAIEQPIIVRQSDPTWEENEENLTKAKDSLRNFYISINDADQSTMDKSHKPDEDNSFITRRRKRSLDQSFNAQIEQRVSQIVANKTNANRTDAFDKYGLLDKISQMVASIEKIDNLSDLTDLGLLAKEIKEIEEFLLKKSLKFKLFNKQRVPNTQQRLGRTDDTPRKCKILAMNLERQCLRDVKIFPRNLVKREVLQSQAIRKSKKSHVKSKSRQRRSTAVNWISDHDDDIRTNMIPANPDAFSDHIVPSVYIANSYKPVKSDVIQHIPYATTNDVHIAKTTHHLDAPTQNGINLTDGINDNNTMYDSPQFMKSITSSLESILDIVNRHVSGWWQMLS